MGARQCYNLLIIEAIMELDNSFGNTREYAPHAIENLLDSGQHLHRLDHTEYLRFEYGQLPALHQVDGRPVLRPWQTRQYDQVSKESSGLPFPTALLAERLSKNTKSRT